MLRGITENFMLKLLALIFSVMLWFFVTGEHQLEKGYAVPLELSNIPEGLIVASEVPSLIDVRIAGPRTVLLNLSPADLNIAVDLKGLSPGVTTFKKLDERFRLPRSLTVTRLSPAVIDVRLEKVQQKKVPVHTVFTGMLPEGLTVGEIEIDPKQVVVVGAGSELKSVNVVETEPIDISEVHESFNQQASLDYVGKFTSLAEQQTVEVRVTIIAGQPEQQKGNK